MFCGLTQVTAAEKRRKKKPESANSGPFQEAATVTRRIPSIQDAFIVAAPADFFNPKKHNSHGMAKK